MAETFFGSFFNFVQNNAVLKSDTFRANISVYVQAYGPKFDLMDSFSTLIKINLSFGKLIAYDAFLNFRLRVTKSQFF